MISGPMTSAVLGACILIAVPASAGAQPMTGAASAASAGFAGMMSGICIGSIEACRPAQAYLSDLDLLVIFELNSAELTPEARRQLDDFARELADRRLTSARILVEGHADAWGTQAYNQSLSERRAETVAQFLYDHGISRDMVETVGFGKSRPRLPDPYDPDNRRVEMRIETR